MDNFAKEELEEIKIKQSKGGQLFILILSILMTIVSLFSVLIAFSEENWGIVIVSIIGVLFFGFGILVLAKSFFAKQYVLILNEEGFYDYSSTLSTNDTLIPWDQVTSIDIVQVTSEYFVALSLKDPNLAKNARTKMGNMVAKANKGLGYADVLITTKTAKGFSAEEVGSLMHEYWTRTSGHAIKENTEEEVAELKNLDDL